MARQTNKLEADYQPQLKAKLRALFPGCQIFKLDSAEYQGIPDLLILWGRQWAILEVKRYHGARKRPNQEWYVETFNEMSFSAFISPENEEAVLNDLQYAFGVSR